MEKSNPKPLDLTEKKQICLLSHQVIEGVAAGR
jgi:hypothetical protein